MTRFNDATALADTELYVLQREQFEKLREEHKRLACHLVEAVAKVLALRSVSYTHLDVYKRQVSRSGYPGRLGARVAARNPGMRVGPVGLHGSGCTAERC